MNTSLSIIIMILGFVTACGAVSLVVWILFAERIEQYLTSTQSDPESNDTPWR